ncbi:bifunctional sugar phosphate isomerase/epimerase/4-hydroxyphenylpyruvate dioxygenase family protein [Shinella kummerowiae]|uniref:bifunctional sugar phosphate isomerase/epimerase/4-hydroxyphenylpyruvate dioxygenase family protein n=1 Tax=Shinella kummerowiae TaxID=417745 RepID=UPI0021B51B21|nr:sugar phosphate isomerase/epimerase and 4-hydroxyphenylpyruvate domain-containing protein [Shinella kummerowiae]MCT7664555.1 sugar phosphate isomerase/epimerase and 4-hydroxyphenylpyruvate domain-containing protein [Shinella kummerowiae]
MKTSIATVSLSGDLRDKLGAIAKAGFDGVEIFENDFLVFDESPKQLGRMVRDFGLEITLFQPFRDFEGMPEPLRSRTFDRAERKFDLMQDMGTDLVLVCSNVSSAALGGLDRAAADFHELGERAEKRGLRVGYEALAWGRHIHDHRDAWEIVRRADHANIGLILDSFHTLARKIDVNSIRSIPKEKIFIIQLADAPKIDMDLLYWSRHFRNMPGEGELPVEAFMAAVVETGYDGYLSLEIFNDQFRGGSPAAIAADGYRSLVYLGDRVRRANPGLSVNVPGMPDRSRVDGVAFVEFAVDETEASALETMITTLGFRRDARHKTKNVTVFRQGDIRLVVNADGRGFASSSYLVHGTSAYAMGLLVEDAWAARARAIALGAEAFEQPLDRGEIEMPAVRGVGGGIIYLLDRSTDLARIWDIEFDPIEDGAGTRDAGLQTIDHLAQTMPYDELLTWLLFYTAIFDAGKTPMVDIVDPSGLVRSQAIENGEGSLRITMNGAENRNTVAGRFITETFGSGIQHLAFTTDDIFATAGALAANGFAALEISPNYYDDLEARFGLDPALTEKLQSHNILYDRDEHGEYFQLYSPTYREGFFFEIVQRKGYRGYGAANAIFRIAALRRHLRPMGMPRA